MYCVGLEGGGSSTKVVVYNIQTYKQLLMKTFAISTNKCSMGYERALDSMNSCIQQCLNQLNLNISQLSFLGITASGFNSTNEGSNYLKHNYGYNCEIQLLHDTDGPLNAYYLQFKSMCNVCAIIAGTGSSAKIVLNVFDTEDFQLKYNYKLLRGFGQQLSRFSNPSAFYTVMYLMNAILDKEQYDETNYCEGLVNLFLEHCYTNQEYIDGQIKLISNVQQQNYNEKLNIISHIFEILSNRKVIAGFCQEICQVYQEYIALSNDQTIQYNIIENEYVFKLLHKYHFKIEDLELIQLLMYRSMFHLANLVKHNYFHFIQNLIKVSETKTQVQDDDEMSQSISIEQFDMVLNNKGKIINQQKVKKSSVKLRDEVFSYLANNNQLLQNQLLSQYQYFNSKLAQQMIQLEEQNTPLPYQLTVIKIGSYWNNVENNHMLRKVFYMFLDDLSYQNYTQNQNSNISEHVRFIKLKNEAAAIGICLGQNNLSIIRQHNNFIEQDFDLFEMNDNM